MRFTCEKSYLLAALGASNRAVSNRNTLPILSNVLVQTEDDRVKFTATDLDTAIHALCPATVGENGAVAIPAQVLADTVNKMPDAPITLELQDGKVAISCGKSRSQVLCLPAEDFPMVPSVDGGTTLTVKQSVLYDMLEMTTMAASEEETRSILMGILFEAKNTKLTLVATDTQRLALKSTELAKAVAAPVAQIVPAKPLAALMRLLKPKSDGVVAMRFGESQVQFETDDVTMVSRVLSGQFPNYEKVIPKPDGGKLTLDRTEFMACLARLYVVAKQNSEKGVYAWSDGVMKLAAECQDIGQSDDEIPVQIDGPDLQIAINIRYLQDFLSRLKCEQVTMHYQGALNPVLIQDGSDFLGVIMPMAV